MSLKLQMPSQEVIEKFKDVVAVVEATDYEVMVITEKLKEWDLVKFEERVYSHYLTLASVKLPYERYELNILIQINVYTVEKTKRQVAFWSTCSRLVDYDIIKDGLGQIMKNSKHFTTIWNIHNIIDSLNEVV